MYNILIVEDEDTIRRITKEYFVKKGFTVFEASDGQMGLDIFIQAKIDIAIIDVMMPKMDGFELAKRIRSSSNVPIIITTALSSEDDILKFYDLKIDDYIVKPYLPSVLVSKVTNLLNRLYNNNQISNLYTINNLKFDYINNKIYLDNKELDIDNKEFLLLDFFIKNINRICSRELLLDEIWGLDSYVGERIIDTYIKNLRKELQPYNYIKTIFKKGYIFTFDEE